MNNTDWTQLVEDHEIAFLHADVCIGSGPPAGASHSPSPMKCHCDKEVASLAQSLPWHTRPRRVARALGADEECDKRDKEVASLAQSKQPHAAAKGC